MYDVFFLSYHELLADFRWGELLKLAPHARRIDGIPGILNAHKHCAEQSRTSNFFAIDADNEIVHDFDFNIKLSIYDKNLVHIWRAKNPLNGLVYGWGGIKLFPKKLLLALDDMPIDMTTSFPLKIVPVTGSTTYFNTTAYDTWRSAFRECVKLAKNDDYQSYERLQVWCKTAKGMHSEACLTGANAGREYGLKYKDDPDMLMKINDWSWLEAMYKDNT